MFESVCEAGLEKRYYRQGTTDTTGRGTIPEEHLLQAPAGNICHLESDAVDILGDSDDPSSCTGVQAVIINTT